MEGLLSEQEVASLIEAAAADARQNLLKGDYLAAAFSAAHVVCLGSAQTWTSDELTLMAEALEREVRTQLARGDEANAAWRAAYFKLLTGRDAVQRQERDRLSEAVRPLGDWNQVRTAGRAADYYLVSGQRACGDVEMAQMLEAVGQDLQRRISDGDLVLAADRLALYKVLSKAGRP